MADRLDAVIDHVAIAVPDPKAAEARWRAQLGGGRSSMERNPVFASRQLRFANGGKLELLSPSREDPTPGNFVRRFLERFGPAVHHVTLKVPDLHQAVGVLARVGLDTVDVRDDIEYWQEGFLRPSQIGGLVVQIAATPFNDADWARFTGFRPDEPGDTAAALWGPLLRHPDLDRARSVWTALGAAITEEPDGALRCAWPDSALDVVIRPGEPAGTIGLRMTGTGDMPAADGVGPAVLDVGAAS